MLSLSIGAEHMKVIAWGHLQILEPHSQVYIFELASSAPGDVGRKSLGLPCGIEITGGTVCERLDHKTDCIASRDAGQTPSAAQRRRLVSAGAAKGCG
jgi:hypothetical protein